jgi:hypothetical protein
LAHVKKVALAANRPALGSSLTYTGGTSICTYTRLDNLRFPKKNLKKSKESEIGNTIAHTSNDRFKLDEVRKFIVVNTP